jgi:lipopolysaccharide/colanic/teichoic acid biosynthesis glycosyltransferase
VAKRLFDVIVALLGIVVLSPLLVGIALAIKISSPGPVLYRGQRVGRFGKPFRICKFRTMVVNAEKIGGASSGDDDPRITKVGRFLRKYKLDELPQLFNVLRGEMSLVGPRPEVQKFVDMYTEEEKLILKLRPGITDWASLWNCDEGAVLAGAADADQAYLELIRPTKIALQLKYAREHSFWVDIRILMFTLWRLVKKDWVPVELQGVPVPTAGGSVR